MSASLCKLYKIPTVGDAEEEAVDPQQHDSELLSSSEDPDATDKQNTVLMHPSWA